MSISQLCREGRSELVKLQFHTAESAGAGAHNSLRRFSATLMLAALLFPLSLRAQNIVINEIMYHPSSHQAREEYVELYNLGATNVNLTGWHLARGVDFLFPSNTVIQAGNYLVVAAHRQTFTNKYPGVANVVGDYLGVRLIPFHTSVLTNFENTLSNTRNEVRLENPAGSTVDSVIYADEGEWAQRRRGNLDADYRGWTWFAEHDGLGKSLELINAALPNEHGQNWTASTVVHGTPGQPNSVGSANIAPLIVNASHLPVVPRSSNTVTVTAQVINETPVGVSVGLAWRVDALTPPVFLTNVMFDDGLHGDGLAGDGLYAGTIPAQPNNSIVEFFIVARDGQGNTRTWPAPALAAEDEPGPSTQAANALYQVDDSPLNDFGGTSSRQPIYKLIMTANEANDLQNMACSVPGPVVCRTSEAQMNATVISIDSVQAEVRYFAGIKRRGHGSRTANPRNYRVNFPSDAMLNDASGLVLNTRQVHLQHVGATLANAAGAAGGYTRAVQVRVNNVNMAAAAGQMFGSYAANEVFGSEWAENHFPLDDGGNGYKAIRDIVPPNFDYRGTDKNSYTNTYFKESNSSEEDWTDLITMLSVMGENAGASFTEANARSVVNVEQWLTHLAVMNLLGNNESGLNTGFNDDYFLYRGVNDPRFILTFHDLDSILGQGGSLGPTAGIYSSVNPNGSGNAFGQFLFSPSFEPLYYATLQRLLDTTFSQAQFDAVVDQTLRDYVSSGMIGSLKSWMNQRRVFVQGAIAGLVPPATNNPVATISGEPRSPSPLRTATLTVGGDSITSYRFKVNNGTYGVETSVATPISLANLPVNSTNTVYVIGKNSGGIFQSTNSPTLSKTWIVNTNTPRVRLNEVLAQNAGSLNHQGTFPDAIELFNEGAASVNLGGLRLTDDPANPARFTFPANTMIAAGDFLVVYANTDDGTGGLHTGFSLGAGGEGVYLFSTNNVLLDSVVFGLQMTDASLGRFGASGEWKLCTPTFPGVNTARPTGDSRTLRINEWLTSGTAPFAEDFVEIYNSTPLPIDFGGCSFTDRPLGDPGLSRVPPLSFIPANAFVALTADGNLDSGADHLDFALSSDVGEIALFDPLLKLIDSVIYGPQSVNVSQGRCPDGANNFAFLLAPTPGAGNLCPPPAALPTTILGYTNQWRYDATGINWGTAWRATNFNDSAWPVGRGLLGFSGAPGNIPESILTALPVSNTRTTYYFRTTFALPPGVISAQFSHVIDDGAVFYLNGQELSPRVNLPGSTINATTFAQNAVGDASYGGPITLPLESLLPGTNWLAAEVHQINPGSSDIIFGVKLEVTTNSVTTSGVVINEILANNSNILETDGRAPDWVEFYNPSGSPVDLGEASLTDSPAVPRRWVFPSGSLIPAGGYRRVLFSANDPVSTTNTGFGLKDTGDALYLFASGGALLDTRSFGLQAVDFSIGRFPSGSTNWVLTVPTAGAANAPAALGDVLQMKVNEWMASPAVGEDWFELFNPNAQPVALGEHWLSDVLTTPANRMKNQLPKLSFLGVGAYAYQRFEADDVAQNSPEHVNFKLGAGGDSIGISLPDGTLINGVTFGAQATDVSQGRLPDGAAGIVSFPVSPSPGDLNWLPLTNIVINEVLTHTDPPLEDAIELMNVGSVATNLNGWFLSDAKNDLKRYPITGGISIPPGSFRVLYETQFNNTAIPTSAFALSSSKGDQVYLSAATNGVLTGYRAQVTFGAAANGVSFGRHRTSVGTYDFVAQSARTFGVDSPATVAQFRTGTGLLNVYPKVGPVVFSEIMYHPTDLNAADNLRDEFLELKNTTGGAVNLFDPAYPTNRWKIRGGVDFDFPPNTMLDASGTLLVVSFDPVANPAELATFKSVYGISNNVAILGPWVGKLDNASEELELLRPDPPQLPPAADAGFVPFVLVEKIIYSDRAPWTTNADGTGFSLQRVSATGYGNDPTNWLAALPTASPVGQGDSDGDGLPDVWENTHGFDSGNPTDAGLDADLDGLTNLQEYLAGTDPRDAASRLWLQSLAPAGNLWVLRFNAIANKSYTVQWRPSLATGTWQQLEAFPALPTNRLTYFTNLLSAPAQFYRLTTP